MRRDSRWGKQAIELRGLLRAAAAFELFVGRVEIRAYILHVRVRWRSRNGRGEVLTRNETQHVDRCKKRTALFIGRAVEAQMMSAIAAKVHNSLVEAKAIGCELEDVQSDHRAGHETDGVDTRQRFQRCGDDLFLFWGVNGHGEPLLVAVFCYI